MENAGKMCWKTLLDFRSPFCNEIMKQCSYRPGQTSACGISKLGGSINRK